MTLGELIDRYRLHLEDEPVGVRRSWEDTFRYAVRHYPPETDGAHIRRMPDDAGCLRPCSSQIAAAYRCFRLVRTAAS